MKNEPASTIRQSSSSFGQIEGNGNATSNSYFSPPPAISLPKGGGAIKGMGEKFAANPVTGTGSMSVPIATSSGRSGFGPQLSLSYDSGAGNGIFGLGWNLSLPSITRKTDKGLPRYWDAEESDVFILSGAEDLVPVLKDGIVDETLRDGYRIRQYRPRIEGLFARIERWTNVTSGEVHWRSISKDNITTLYGKTAESRIADPSDRTRRDPPPVPLGKGEASTIFSWLICESYDDKGNAIRYDYKSEDSAGISLAQVHERNRTVESRSANRHLKRIQYGNQTPRQPDEELSLRRDWMFEVVFDYGEHDLINPTPIDSGVWTVRNDPFSSYRSGFEVRTYRLCQRVLMFHHFPDEVNVGQDCLVRSTDFTYSYEQNPIDVRNPIYSLLLSVKQTGYKRNSEGGYIQKSLPPLEFTYSEANIDETVREVDCASLENLPQGLDGTRYQWVDLDGEGLSGILTEQGNGWFYKRNFSPVNTVKIDGFKQIEARFAPVELVARKPATGLNNGAQFLDLAGDGQLDLVNFRSPTPGFYERTHNEDWESFIAFKSLPNLNWDNPNLKFIDLNGDGHSDILITEENCFVWHPSLAEDGFGAAEKVHQPWDEEKGPRIVFFDSTQSIYLVDMSGDGLTDIVRIRNGEICYWPNLGYGKFGVKVTMDNAPWFDALDIFNQRRIVLADIDGSGTTDILYLCGEGVQVYFNQSGNSWSAKRVLREFPAIDNTVSVTTVDLLGNGTTCLVWSSPLPGNATQSMRYIDLMGGQKPHLLIKTVNNLGAETVVQYAPSTKFYLQDKLAGKPWITKLPFPVHVVEKVTVVDRWRQTRFTSTYSYHHGYFDGIDREFRGFGRVEQTDVEDFGTFATGNTSSPYISDDRTLYQPPIKTITWFHTGAFLDREHILSQFQQEYFEIDRFIEKTLPEPDLTVFDLSAEEWREALRSCKGMMLRQEIYELDVDALERGEERRVKLFSTAFHNCQIQRLQPRGSNRHAVFLVTESEAITYHYELDLRAELQPDPRIAHTLNLRMDEYGNVLESVAIAYPRSPLTPLNKGGTGFKVPLFKGDLGGSKTTPESYPRITQYEDANLPEDAVSAIQQVQKERHLIYTENHFTNDVIETDAYRLRLPCEVKTYELTGIEPTEGFYYTLEELRSTRIETAIPEIPYHVLPNGNIPQKRLVEWVRMLYFSADLQNSLPWGELNHLGLPYETYKLALTDELLTEILTPDRLTLAVRQDLENADVSGYLSGVTLAARFPDLDTSGQYWIRSGIAGFAEDAAQHFYLPERYTDPFGNTTTLEYDARDLYIRSSRDAIGNTTTVDVFDYRVLAPRQLRDINNNLSEVLFDALGMPIAMAVLGKENEGDNLTGFDETLLHPDAETLIRFFTEDYDEAEARRFLGNATTRYLYYFGEDTGGVTYNHHPACAAGLVREIHVAEGGANSPLQAGFEYSDGMGTVLVKKVQAEPETEGEPLRWIASGKTILNNKGKPVKQYEPYFSLHHRWDNEEASQEVGVTPILYYDAAGRQVRAEMPDGSYSRVEFSPWLMATWDANDTVLEPGNAWYARYASGTAEERQAARLAAIHANTPAVTHLDSLGREAVAIAHNKLQRDGVITEEKYLTYTKLDIEGKPLWIQDARGNRVMEYINRPGAERDFVPCYDIAGNLLFQHSMDGGNRWMLVDAAGKPFYAWDEGDRRFCTKYDELHRPIGSFVKGADPLDANREIQSEKIVYGDTPNNGLSDNQKTQLNLRGKPYQQFDSAGIVVNKGQNPLTGEDEAFDFKGNLLRSTRQLIQDYKKAPDWSQTPALEAEVFSSSTHYDALNRPMQLTTPDNSVMIPVFNEANLLDRVKVKLRGSQVETLFIKNIDYNAKGQRTLIEYGNDAADRAVVKTEYRYDRETMRLIQLKTTRKNDGAVLQNLSYTYDPVGNITNIQDTAQQIIYFNREVVSPATQYQYDALYRLIQAAGREHIGQTANQPSETRADLKPHYDFNDWTRRNLPHPNQGQAMRNYTEEYRYDPVGNILAMIHRANGNSWQRNYDCAIDNNRLLKTSLPGNRWGTYEYDVRGNMTRMPHLSVMEWNYKNELQATQRQVVNGGTGEKTYYVYDAAGQRVRKVTELREGVRKDERLYLGGFEIYRAYDVANGTVKLERETLHVMDDKQQIALVETKTVTNPDDESPAQLIRFQFGNHLGSASLELDDKGNVISYEEYYPYGSTSYHAVDKSIKAAAKRYRYTGKERDEETGLYYHGARYYAPWLGRWISCDPIRLRGGMNLYSYVNNKPIVMYDPKGTDEESGIIKMKGIETFNTHEWKAGVKKALDNDPLLVRMKKERQEVLTKDIDTILDAQSSGAVDINTTVKNQLEQLKQHPDYININGGKLDVGDPKVIHILASLAEKAKERFLSAGKKLPDMVIASLFRAGTGQKKEGLHQEGLAVDLSRYGGKDLSANNKSYVEGLQQLISDLPEGHYGVGLPRLPLKTSLTSEQAHNDQKAFPKLFEPLPSNQSPLEVQPNEKLLNMDDPNTNSKDTASWTNRGLGNFKPGVKEKMEKFTKEMDERQIMILMYFPDGFDHIHLSVVGANAKRF
jgi:RHS repeat-associated protein